MPTPLHQLDTPLKNSEIVTYKTALENTQGNMLKSHGRDHCAHVFLTFTGNLDAVKQFVAAMSLHVTSAAEQQAQTDRHKANPHVNEMFTQFLLSARGYEYIGSNTTGFSPQFRSGMKGSATLLADPPVAAWEDRYKRELHALIILAHDIPDALEDRVDELETALRGVADMFVQDGTAMHNADGNTIEHFGYVDGRSQPRFFEQEVIDEKGGTANWDPSAGPSLILLKDPLGSSDDDCSSYYVFRKLEQDVRGFKQHEQDLANALALTGGARELAGAMVVGRFEDGTPVVLHDDAVVHQPAGPAAIIENDFTYAAADAPGSKCPFSGHIRKTNPRGDTGNIPAEKTRRIARRGITFGDPTPPGDDISKLPTGGVGLLFQCCNKAIDQQFEFMQSAWADNPHFTHNAGVDPVMGQANGSGFPAQNWPAPYGSPTRVSFGFNNFVHMRGGEYFFVPSITFLKSLAH